MFTQSTGAPAGVNDEGARVLTVSAIAESTRLPVHFLHSLELTDDASGVSFPYCTWEGRALGRRTLTGLRTAASGDAGASLGAYGLNQLRLVARSGYLVLVGAETDCWPLWFYRVPALALPQGAGAVTAELLHDIPRLYLHRMPGPEGEAFVEGLTRRLGALGYAGEVFELNLPTGADHPCALHAADPLNFGVRLHAALAAARPIEVMRKEDGAENEPCTSARGSGRPSGDACSLSAAVREGASSTAQPETGRAADLATKQITEPNGNRAVSAPLRDVRVAQVSGRTEERPRTAGLSFLSIAAAAKASRPLRWLLPGRIPFGQVTVLDGDPDQGKSCLMLDLAARLTRGKPMPLADPSTATPPAGVIVLCAEDSVKQVVLPRLQVAGADLDRIIAIRRSFAEAQAAAAPGERDEAASISAQSVQLPRDIAALRELVIRSGARLLIIDPLVAYVGEGVNWHLDHSVRRVLLPLAQLAEELDIAIVVIRHLNKETGPKAIYRGSGTMGIIGTAHSGLLVLSDPDDRDVHLLVTIKQNLAERAAALRYALRSAGDYVRVDWLGECEVDADALLRRLPHPDDAPALADAMDYLKERLSHGPALAADVIRQARELCIKDMTLKRARLRLGVVPRFQSDGNASGGRWLWSLPRDEA